MKLSPLPNASTASSVLNLRLISLTAFVFRCPSPVPVRTSFGIMRDRPAVFVKAESEDGHVGWGEVWCNFPSCGAEHRARLLDTVIAPLLLNKDFNHPAYAFEEASSKTHVLALQSGELGPIAQVIAGVDIALWDLCARRAKLPLYQLLGGSNPRIGVYASGINPDGSLQTVQKKHQEGFRAFKLKIGFDTQLDITNLRSVREWLDPSHELMADVNQAWDLAQALETLPRLEPYGLSWLEEPLRCDSEMRQWQELKAHSRIPLAAGENMLGSASFMSAMDSKAFDVLQPDIAKWGGISATWAVIQKTLSRGLRYCPHYLGAGIGLMASAHLLAAVGGDGLLEVDANENPLRTLLAPALQKVDNGFITLTQDPGLGIELDLDALSMACQQR
jgi:L-alanine-DL-glutamate epimerase-like enolase superfamily enzyme